jgi:signal transduction histidine kinase
MPVHPIPSPEDDSFLPPPAPSEGESEAVLEAWAQAMRADSRTRNLLNHYRQLEAELEERTRQAVLMRRVSNLLTATAGPGALAHLILEVLQGELGASQGMVWVLGEDRFQATHGMGFDRRQLASLWLPVPHPFPHYPVLIYQCQWLEAEALPPGVKLIQARSDEGLYFVPLEHQTLLVGFAVLSLPNSRNFQPIEQESMEILQRLFAASLHSTWMMQDLQHQREFLREEARSLKLKAEMLDQRNENLRQGQYLQVDFMAHATQALRGQLDGLLVVMEKARGESDPESRAAGLQDGVLSGRHMAELLRALSELARPEMAVGVPRPMALQPFFEELQPLLMALLRRENGHFVLPEPSTLMEYPEALVDKETLRQVILILSLGALCGSREGHLRLQVEREPVSIRLLFWMEDLEPGEAAAAFQAHASAVPGLPAHDGTGTMGLGLVVAQELMITMGCDLAVEPDPGGRGTQILLELPLA